MEIYPERQLAMLLAAFLLGGLFGLVRQLQSVLRVLIGAHPPCESMRARFARARPLLPLGIPFPRKKRRFFRGTLLFLGDVLYCLCFSFSLLLLLYHYQDGAIRLAVPVLALLGLASVHTLLARRIAHLKDRLALLLAVLCAYVRILICLPFLLLWRLVRRLLLAPFFRVWRILREKRLERISAALCRAQLKAAERGLLQWKGVGADVKRKGQPYAMGHSHSDHSAVLHRTDRGLYAPDGIQRAPRAEKRTGRTKGTIRAIRE